MQRAGFFCATTGRIASGGPNSSFSPSTPLALFFGWKMCFQGNVEGFYTSSVPQQLLIELSTESCWLLPPAAELHCCSPVNTERIKDESAYILYFVPLNLSWLLLTARVSPCSFLGNFCKRGFQKDWPKETQMASCLRQGKNSWSPGVQPDAFNHYTKMASYSQHSDLFFLSIVQLFVQHRTHIQCIPKVTMCLIHIIP